MAKWYHPEVKEPVDVFPPDAQSEEALRKLGMYPIETESPKAQEQLKRVRKAAKALASEE